MYFSGWLATLVVIAALVVVALLLTALFWLGIILAALAAVIWFNFFVLPKIATRTRIPQLVLAAALLPIAAAVGLGLAGTSGAIAGATVWLLGVALPRALLWRMRRRLRQAQIHTDKPVRVIDTRFTSRSR
jgi:hypothetical protein